MSSPQAAAAIAAEMLNDEMLRRETAAAEREDAANAALAEANAKYEETRQVGGRSSQNPIFTGVFGHLSQ